MQAPDVDLAAYEADTYTVIGQIAEIGEFGDQRAEAAFTALNDGRTVREASTYST